MTFHVIIQLSKMKLDFIYFGKFIKFAYLQSLYSFNAHKGAIPIDTNTPLWKILIIISTLF